MRGHHALNATAWTAGQVERITAAPLPAPPPITALDAAPVIPGLFLWDLWPVQHRDGRVAVVAGAELWLALSAPATPDPVKRHDRARIRLLVHDGAGWSDLGDALPDGLSPGSREWSGSAILDGNRLTLFFTAAGRRGEAGISYEQRLFAVTARLDDGHRLSDWSVPVEAVRSDGIVYHPAQQDDGVVGTIKAFRDPAYFRDPADGAEYLLFTGSLAASPSAFNGAIGLAQRVGGAWTLLPPLLHADTVNNELERPHVVVHKGHYYLFWSTQASVFAPGITAPTGLYGMVAERLLGPYVPLNGSGLVLANPAAAPSQSYSWLVLADLRVASFIDLLDDGAFGGVPGPMRHLVLDGATTQLL